MPLSILGSALIFRATFCPQRLTEYDEFLTARYATGVAVGRIERDTAQLAVVDMLPLAHEYHTVILDRIPVMTFERRNSAKRFIILVDGFATSM